MSCRSCAVKGARSVYLLAAFGILMYLFDIYVEYKVPSAEYTCTVYS